MDEDEPTALVLKARNLAQQGDWSQARELAIIAAEAAIEQADYVALRMAGNCLEKLDDRVGSWRYLALAGRGLKGVQEPEWDGGPVGQGTLLIEQQVRDLGDMLRTGRLVAIAAERVQHCELRINPRLAGLFQRTCPTVRVVSSDLDLSREHVTAVASFESLSLLLAADPASLKAGFRPLAPDDSEVRRLRASYHGAHPSVPVIGISWTTRNLAQDIPPIEAWCGLLRRLPATFVSLQYGEVDDDLEVFRRNRVDIIYDRSIDALGDLDPFAAQVAALDAVISVSNTAANMAGALGVPTVIILDDLFHLFWSVVGSTTPWYPSATLVRRQSRAWDQVFAEPAFEALLSPRAEIIPDAHARASAPKS